MVEAGKQSFWCVNHIVHYLQGEFLWFNFFEPFQHVTISFKVDSTLNHLIHVAFLKSDIIRNIDELYVHVTLKRYKTSQLLSKLETYTRLSAADLVKPDLRLVSRSPSNLTSPKSYFEIKSQEKQGFF